MSAANRGAARRPHDFYATPQAALLPLRSWLDEQAVRMSEILDPSAGDGAILRMFFGRRYAIELREECRESLLKLDAGVTIGDALTMTADVTEPVYHLVVCNPPFSLAREFVTAYRYVGLTSAFLLRLGFLASQTRAPWWAEDPPAHVLVLPTRPSFTGDGKSDSADYAWVVWRGKTPKGYTRLDWLG